LMWTGGQWRGNALTILGVAFAKKSPANSSPNDRIDDRFDFNLPMADTSSCRHGGQSQRCHLKRQVCTDKRRAFLKLGGPCSDVLASHSVNSIPAAMRCRTHRRALISTNEIRLRVANLGPSTKSTIKSDTKRYNSTGPYARPLTAKGV
jgi:hypothetical protein